MKTEDKLRVLAEAMRADPNFGGSRRLHNPWTFLIGLGFGLVIGFALPFAIPLCR